MKHASFFSGVGGLDLGFERAGIHTVSVSEIDPYANAVLAERFPSAPNLGSITEVNANDIPEADIWSGGFPCQDLSVAGKRAGFAGKRSSLAFTFLDLVEQRRPRWLVLENVPGLFSSNKGADFGRLLYEMEQLRYGVSWRTLDARYFGVPQRRRRVFLVASLESDRAGEVLFECEGCERHPAPRWSQRQGATASIADGSGIAGTLTRRFFKGVNSNIDEPLIVSPSPDTDRVRTADGLARRLDDQQELETFVSTPAHGETYADTLAARDWKGGVANQDIKRRGWLAIVREANFGGYPEDETEATLRSSGGNYGGGSENLAMTLTSPAGGGRRDTIPMTLQGDIRTTHAIVAPTFYERHDQDGRMKQISIAPTLSSKSDNSVDLPHTLGVFSLDNDDLLLPVGLDSHRYRCCGNGVVAPVAEWIGRRIVEVDRQWREEVK